MSCSRGEGGQGQLEGERGDGGGAQGKMERGEIVF